MTSEQYRLAEGLSVTADGTGIVSHAGMALVRALADNIGLTAGRSKTLASKRLLVHDRGRVPKRVRLFACAGRIVRGGRSLQLRLAASWPWATQITAAITRLQTLEPG